MDLLFVRDIRFPLLNQARLQLLRASEKACLGWKSPISSAGKTRTVSLFDFRGAKSHKCATIRT
ncbi:MAG: hypothetical protein CMN75_04535 [Spirochaeta sp.]|nr:hypothetical protein [Spirochaeta sp.]